MIKTLYAKSTVLIAFIFVCFSLVSIGQNKASVVVGQPWPAQKAWQWYNSQPWLTGANYIPSTAINQLEMWQAETFDSATIDRELSWAKSIGFNTMRVFLHSVAFTADSAGFKKRLHTFLNISNKHGIRPMLVFFDDVWNKDPKPGTQPKPKPGIHNSGWMQDPGQKQSYDSTHFPVLEKYVKSVLVAFKHDKRILMWDLYNEPGNSNKGDSTLTLLRKTFEWARSVNPDQPLTAGLWKWELENLNRFQAANSDILSYHNYDEPKDHLRTIQLLKAVDRPMICTEYMARPRNSRFANVMPVLKAQHVGAINWGFVEGKTNTIYAWDTPIPTGEQPDEWFHDIFFRDGKAYRADEVNLIKKLNGVK